MPPTLLLLRHGEAEHNATGKQSRETFPPNDILAIDDNSPLTENYSIRDPQLTEAGLQQCRELQEHLQQECGLADQVEYIVTSPMRRTLRTTLTALDWLIKRGVPVEVVSYVG